MISWRSREDGCFVAVVGCRRRSCWKRILCVVGFELLWLLRVVVIALFMFIDGCRVLDSYGRKVVWSKGMKSYGWERLMASLWS